MTREQCICSYLDFLFRKGRVSYYKTCYYSTYSLRFDSFYDRKILIYFNPKGDIKYKEVTSRIVYYLMNFFPPMDFYEIKVIITDWAIERIEKYNERKRIH